MVDANPGNLGGKVLRSSAVWAISGTALTAISALVRLVIIGLAVEGPAFADALFLATVVPTVAAIVRLGIDRSGPRLVGAALAVGDAGRAQRALSATLISGAIIALVAALFLISSFSFRFVLAPFLQVDLALLARCLLAIWFGLEVLRTPLAEIARVHTSFGVAFLADSGLRNTLFCVLVALLWLGGPVTLTQMIGAAALANLVVVATAGMRLGIARVRRAELKDMPIRDLASLSPSLLLTLLGALLLASGDLWIVSHFYPDADRAAYLIAFQFATLLAIVMAVENAATQPFITRLIGEDLHRKRLSAILRLAATIGLLVVAIGVVILLGSVLLIPDHIRGIDTQLAALLTVLLATGQLFSVACGPCGTVFIMSGRVGLGMIITLVVGLGVIGIEWALARVAPIWAVAAVSGGGVIVLNVSLAIAAARVLGLRTYASLLPSTVRQLRSLANESADEDT